MFSRQLRILSNVNKQLSRLRFYSAAIIRQANLKTVSNNQYETLKNSKQINTLSPALYQSVKYSNVKSKEKHQKVDNDYDTESNEDVESSQGEDSQVVKITENVYAYSVLKNSDKVNTLVPPLIPDENIPEDVVEEILKKSYDDSSPGEVLEDFRLLSYYRGYHKKGELSSKHHSILQALKRYIGDFTDEELKSLFLYLEMWYPMMISMKNPILKELEKALDEECVQRMNDWSITEWLNMCDLCFRIRQARFFYFVGRCIRKLERKCSRLTAGDLLHYMFLFNVGRIQDVNMYELEYHIEKHLNKYSSNEMSIIALGFFKSKSPFRNPAMMEKIIETCIKEVNEIDEIALSAIMKITRYSMGLHSLTRFQKFLYLLQPKIKTLSASCLVHVAHAAATVLAYEKDIIDELVDQFTPSIPTARLKDLERMLFAMSIFNYPKECPQYNLIIEELRNPKRLGEIQLFPQCLSSSLMYLTHANIYPVDIISKVLSPQYLKDTYKNNAFAIGRECLEVDMGLKIDVPEYTGPFLPDKALNYLTKRYSATDVEFKSSTGKIPSFHRFIIEFVQLLKEVTGSKDIICKQLLPHHQRADVVICVDKNNNIISTDEYFPILDFKSIKYAPKEPADSRWVVFIVASHNHIFRNTVEPCGYLACKIRQLKKIGYHPIVVPHSTWFDSNNKTLTDKKNYLKELLLKHDINTQSEI